MYVAEIEKCLFYITFFLGLFEKSKNVRGQLVFKNQLIKISLYEQGGHKIHSFLEQEQILCILEP